MAAITETVDQVELKADDSPRPVGLQAARGRTCSSSLDPVLGGVHRPQSSTFSFQGRTPQRSVRSASASATLRASAVMREPSPRFSDPHLDRTQRNKELKSGVVSGNSQIQADRSSSGHLPYVTSPAASAAWMPAETWR